MLLIQFNVKHANKSVDIKTYAIENVFCVYIENRRYYVDNNNFHSVEREKKKPQKQHQLQQKHDTPKRKIKRKHQNIMNFYPLL